MRHHQRPGGERHELEREQEGEGVVGEHGEVHAGEIGGHEREHAAGRGLVPAVADGVERGGGAAEVDDEEKERGERVHAQVRAEAGKPDRQDQGAVAGGGEKARQRGRERDERDEAG